MKATKSIGYLIIGLFCTTVGVKAMAACVPFVAGLALTADKYTAETALTATATYADQSTVKDTQKFRGSSTIFYFFDAQKGCPKKGRISLSTANKNGSTDSVTFDYKLIGSQYIISCPFGCSYDRCCGTTSKAGNLAVNAGDKETKVCLGATQCTQ